MKGRWEMAKEKKAELGFEAKLFSAADKLRNNMDAAEYKHVVLGLIFLKYVSDSFEAKYQELVTGKAEGMDSEDPDEYISENVFWVPEKARWRYISSNARSSEIGRVIDEAMIEIERNNKSLKGTLPKDYARPSLDQVKLGEVVDLIGTISLSDSSNKSKDILGRVYEYFLGQFASAEGKKGGQFYTPNSVVKLLVSMLAPETGSRIYDPCCGSGGMFVQSEEFIEAHGGRIGDVSIYGQESNPTTWRLAKMNLAIRGIDNNLGDTNGDPFLNDKHPDLQADYVIANPPFNMKGWGRPNLMDDGRWKYGLPPENNANFAWVQHFISHLNTKGLAGFVLANGSLSSKTSGEGDIRERLVVEGLVDCIVSMPAQLFYSTGIPACLWFISRDKVSRMNESRNHILFIDARNMGEMIDRTHRQFSDKDVEKISDTYHKWKSGEEYHDITGFCNSASLEDVKANDFILTPGRYVGIEEAEEDGEPYEEKMKRLTSELSELFDESDRLKEEIRKNLGALGFEM
jgi:type I restriction enzyme M protein